VVGALAAGLALSTAAYAPAAEPPTWGPATPIDASPGRVETCARSALAGDGSSRLYVVTTDDARPGQADAVRFVRSTDAGATWSGSARLSPAARTAGGASVAASGTRVHAVWARGGPTRLDSSVVVRSNTANGAPGAWRRSVRLTPADGRVGTPTIAASGSSVYVAVTRMGLVSGTGGGQILLFTSRDAGRTWSRRVVGEVGRSKSHQVTSRPVVVASGRSVAVAWVQVEHPAGSPSRRTAIIRTSTDRGAHLSSARALGPARLVAAAARGGRIAVTGVTLVADDGPGWVRVRDGGRWQPRRALPGTWRVAAVPTLRSGHLLAVATARYEGVDLDAVTVLEWAQSADDGRTWSPTERVSTPGEPVYDVCGARWTRGGGAHVLSSVLDSEETRGAVVLHSRR
jgi:hypothetical protein